MTEYVIPAGVQEAIACLEMYRGEARVLAGGTDVLPDMRDGKKTPRCLVDITRIPELNEIEITTEWIQVGAAVTFARIKDEPFFKRHVHALADAAGSVGAIGIQNAATWVGNIVQAMPAADGAVVALALEAELCIMDRGGARWEPVERTFAGPGQSTIDPTRQLITHIRFTRPAGAWGTAWRRVGRRPSLVLPILNCAVKLRLNADCTRIERAVVALGPVAPTPFRARQAEAWLVGKAPTSEVFAQAAGLAQTESNPRSSVMRASREYRLELIPALVGEALDNAARRAMGQV